MDCSEIRPLISYYFDGEATPEERDQVKSEGGVMVENAEGAGARAGIQAGDVILRVNEKPVGNIAELRREISGSGEVVALLVLRENKRVYVAVTPG